MRKGDKMKNTAMARRLVAGMALALAATAGAMPTKQELAEAQPIVQDLVAEDMRALKAKEKSVIAVAAEHLKLADKAETEAGKYLFLQGAFRLYARNGDYESAAAVLQRLRSEISNLPPEVIVELVNKEMNRVASEKAPKVLAILRDAQRTVKCRRLLVSLDREVKAKPKDTLPRRRLAECHASLGDWAKALPHFAKLGDEAAKYELDPASVKGFDALKAADFWWGYNAADAEPFRAHAADLYRDAIKKGTVTGLRRDLAAKRVAEVDSLNSAVAATEPPPAPTTGNQPAATVATTPTSAAPVPPAAPVVAKDGVWTLPKTFQMPLERSLDLGGGVTMPFCACPAGSFKMLDHKVTITRPFWISKTVVSLNQLMISPSVKNRINRDKMTVIEKVMKQFHDRFLTFSVDNIVVSAYVSELNIKYRGVLPPKYVFRLPTEAEMYYAYCAGMDETLAVPTRDDAADATTGEAFAALGWIPRVDRWGWNSLPREYSGLRLATLPDANAFGVVPLADSWVTSHILDTIDFDAKNEPSVWGAKRIKELMNYDEEETDPLRKGSCYLEARGCVPRQRDTMLVSKGHSGRFMIVIGPDLESEKKAAKK